MGDLKSHKLIYLKGWLFLGIVIMSSVLILIEHPSWKVGGLLALVIWAPARFYYSAPPQSCDCGPPNHYTSGKGL